MAGFNLIPERYILWRKFVSDLRTFLIFLVLSLSLGVAGRVWLQRDIQNQSSDISALRKSSAYLDSQHAEIRDLLDSKSILETRFKLVNGLKGDLTAAELFLAMDSALSDDIEFESWNFQRVAQPAKQEQLASHSSYFIVVDEVIDDGLDVDGVQIRAEMTLIGRAKSHSAMAEFMGNLSQQAVIGRVDLVRSGSGRGQKNGGVEFEFLLELVTGAETS